METHILEQGFRAETQRLSVRWTTLNLDFLIGKSEIVGEIQSLGQVFWMETQILIVISSPVIPDHLNYNMIHFWRPLFILLKCNPGSAMPGTLSRMNYSARFCYSIDISLSSSPVGTLTSLSSCALLVSFCHCTISTPSLDHSTSTSSALFSSADIKHGIWTSDPLLWTTCSAAK